MGRRIRHCKKRIGYPTKEAAEQHAGVTLEAHLCRHCGWFHLRKLKPAPAILQ